MFVLSMAQLNSSLADVVYLLTNPVLQEMKYKMNSTVPVFSTYSPFSVHGQKRISNENSKILRYQYHHIFELPVNRI